MAHEMVHVVFATKFPHPNRLSSWVEEGVAAQFDDLQRQATRKKIIAAILRDRDWPRLDAILTAQNIPGSRQRTYAVAASLTEFLVSMRDKKTFVQFGASAREIGWDAALQKYYRIDDIDALQLAWQSWVSSRPSDQLAYRAN